MSQQGSEKQTPSSSGSESERSQWGAASPEEGTTKTRESMDGRSQGSYDQAFDQQMAPPVYAQGPTHVWAQEYFELAEQTIRSARRVTELQTLHLMRQEIASDVKREVLAELRAKGIF